MMKSQFLSLWDGIATQSNCMVVVMGATNRPKDVDAAILRRMPCVFHVGLPNARQREAILELVLRDDVVAPDVNLGELARSTEGFSGSDLFELCRTAAIVRVKETFPAFRSAHNDGGGVGDAGFGRITAVAEQTRDVGELRAISARDFREALIKLKTSNVHRPPTANLSSPPGQD